MDRYLQRLKRAAITDPAAQARYIAALERALGGEREEHPELKDSHIAEVVLANDDTFEDLLELLPITRVGHGEGMIDLSWKENFYEEDFVEIEAALSDASRQLLIDAADQGYAFIIFWR